MKLRSLLLVFTAIFLSAATVGAQAQATDLLKQIEQRKVIRIAAPNDYPPFGFAGTDMKPRGIDIEVAELIAQKLNVKLELVPVTGPNRVPYLQSGRADLTISSLGKTPERAKVIDYTIAYSPFYDAVYGRTDIPVKNFDDLSNRTIAVTRGSMQDGELATLAPKAVVRRFEDNNATLAAFLAGQTEMFATGTAVAAAVMAKNPNVKMELKVILANAPCYIGVPKGNPALVEKINDIIRTAKKDGTLDKIIQKWLGTPAGDLPET
jgi:polar amino acid transport system substrate-binding protein